MEQTSSTIDLPTVHWADHAADALIEKHPNKETLVCASGISPSGVVHIGNFREVITVDFVVRALKNKKRKVFQTTKRNSIKDYSYIKLPAPMFAHYLEFDCQNFINDCLRYLKISPV